MRRLGEDQGGVDGQPGPQRSAQWVDIQLQPVRSGVPQGPALLLALFNVLINHRHHGVVVDTLEGRAATQRDVSRLRRGPPDAPELSKGKGGVLHLGQDSPTAQDRRGLTGCGTVLQERTYTGPAEQQVEHMSVVHPCSKESEPRTRQHEGECSWEAEQRGYFPSSSTHQVTFGALCPGLAQRQGKAAGTSTAVFSGLKGGCRVKLFSEEHSKRTRGNKHRWQ